MAYYDFLNVIFAPLLKLPPLLSLIILSFIISLLIILITKYSTDQALMKRLKDEMKEYQNQIKELKGDPAKAMEVQKKSMAVNMKYMSHSLKPTIITFIPIILIFGWMSSTFAFESIKPQQPFSITITFDKNINGEAEIIVVEGLTLLDNNTKQIENGMVTWNLIGNEGEYIIEFKHENEKQDTSVLVTDWKKYINPLKKTDGKIKSIQINYKKLTVFPIGYKDWFGWLGTYIILSIIFTMAMRKIMKVY